MVLVAQASQSERTLFIQRTYGHLIGALAAFTLLEYALLNYSPLAGIMLTIQSSNLLMWLVIWVCFVILSWLARVLASGTSSLQIQYLGFGFYVIGQAIIIFPLLFVATRIRKPSLFSLLPTALFFTGVMLSGLTAIAFTARKDFSFLRGALIIGGFFAFGLILLSNLNFEFSLGLWVSLALLVFASAAILSVTSNIIHRYSTDRYVLASLELFDCVTLLFWVIFRIAMRLGRR